MFINGGVFNGKTRKSGCFAFWDYKWGHKWGYKIWWLNWRYKGIYFFLIMVILVKYIFIVIVNTAICLLVNFIFND